MSVFATLCPACDDQMMTPLFSPQLEQLPVKTVAKPTKPVHVGRARRLIAAAEPIGNMLSRPLERVGLVLLKIANTLRFERFWREKVAGDPRAIVVPTFNKTDGKRPIWNVALNWLLREAATDGLVVEFGTNNGGWLKYFVDRSPRTLRFVGLDCFEGLPEEWDGLPAGSIRGFGAPAELWANDPEARSQIIADAKRGGMFPPPPQPNVRIESGLFSDTLPSLISSEPPQNLRLVHFDADLYISTRPMLDMLCGRLTHRYLILFDEFYSVNHEFKAWNEFVSLYALRDWRVLAASADGSQVLIEMNCSAPTAEAGDRK